MRMQVKCQGREHRYRLLKHEERAARNTSTTHAKVSAICGKIENPGLCPFRTLRCASHHPQLTCDAVEGSLAPVRVRTVRAVSHTAPAPRSRSSVSRRFVIHWRGMLLTGVRCLLLTRSSVSTAPNPLSVTDGYYGCRGSRSLRTGASARTRQLVIAHAFRPSTAACRLRQARVGMKSASEPEWRRDTESKMISGL
jgi:hypothetical protein